MALFRDCVALMVEVGLGNESQKLHGSLAFKSASGSTMVPHNLADPSGLALAVTPSPSDGPKPLKPSHKISDILSQQ